MTSPTRAEYAMVAAGAVASGVFADPLLRALAFALAVLDAVLAP